MKDNFGNDYFLLAHVDHEKVRFDKGMDLGIEFKNQIDAWNRMAFKFRGGRWASPKYARKDLTTLVYAVRERLE